MQTVVLDSTATGGQAGTSSRIENYLGFPSGISGAELADRAVLQARKFGARFAVPAEARSICRDDGQYTIGLDDGTSITAPSVVIATGARYRRLDVPRMDYFEQMSVYYAASQAEALLCRGDPVAIIGGGNSAGQAAVFLSRHAARVTLIVCEDDLGECMSRYLVDQVGRLANVRVLLGTEVRELLGDQALEAVAVEDRRTGSAAWSSSTITALSGPGTTQRGRPTPTPGLRPAGSARRWRPASPVSLLSAMSAVARPSGSPQPSARAR
jgi:thioredoxin reductase (NADPH)